MNALTHTGSLRARRSPRSGGRVRPVRVALLGCGNIGGALADELRAHATLHICAALVRDPTRMRPIGTGLLSTTAEQVLAAKPDLVVECLGGTEWPAQVCEQFLLAGVSVVSANKSMAAAALPALNAAARVSGAHLRFDAAVCAGVPVLEAVARLRHARVRAVRGIVNGTCNYMLHAMEQRGIEQAVALAEATARGYAEPDPTADLSGRDSAEKLCLLAAAAGALVPRLDAIETIGIGDVDRAALADLRALGGTVRLVAHAGNELCVAPTFVPFGSALAAATGTQNVVTIDTELAGTVSLSGPGAGARPTVAALLADILACADGRSGWAEQALGAEPLGNQNASGARWLLRIAKGPSESPLLSPTSLAAAAACAGAEVVGAAFLPGRVLVEVNAAPRARLALVAALEAMGDKTQCFRISEEAVVRF